MRAGRRRDRDFRPGGAARLGLDYDAVRERRLDIVYCTISGFGGREPRDRSGYDFVVQAESGLMSITGEPNGGPMKVGVAVVDVLAGLNAATAILPALRRRDRGGGGELIEISLLDSAFAALVNVAQNALVTGESRSGTATRTRASSRTSRSARPTASWLSPRRTTGSTGDCATRSGVRSLLRTSATP